MVKNIRWYAYCRFKEGILKEFLYQCVDRECILTKEEIVS